MMKPLKPKKFRHPGRAYAQRHATVQDLLNSSAGLQRTLGEQIKVSLGALRLQIDMYHEIVVIELAKMRDEIAVIKERLATLEKGKEMGK